MEDKNKDSKPAKDELDTETTFADMNVEGFRWYRPDKKNGEKLPPLTGAEKRAIARGAVSAVLPFLLGTAVIMLLLAGLAYLWLR